MAQHKFREYVWFYIMLGGCLLALDRGLDAASCSVRWQGSGYQYTWGPLAGCRVKINGKLIPEKQVRGDGQ